MLPVSKNFTWLNPIDFGAMADGATDDSSAIQKTIDAAANAQYSSGPLSGGTVVLPPGRYRLASGLTIPKTMSLLGSGKYQSLLLPDPGIQALTVFGDSLLARNANRSEYLFTTEMGSQLKDFGIVGRNGDGQGGINYVGHIDHVSTWGVLCMHLDSGMRLGLGIGTDNFGFMRESGFYNVTLSHCGSAASPALDIDQANFVVPGDGMNHITFFRLEVTYPKGVGLRIKDEAPAEFVRQVSFHKLMIHGDGQDAASPTQADVMQIVGQVNSVQIYDLEGNGSAPGFAVIRLMRDAASTGWPLNVRIQGSVLNSNGDGVVVEAAQSVALDLMQASPLGGDFVRFDPFSLIGGDRSAHVNLNSHIQPAAVVIDPSVDSKVSGWIDSTVFRMPPNAQVFDAGGVLRTLQVPAGGGAVTAI